MNTTSFCSSFTLLNAAVVCRFVQGVKHAEAYRFYHWANIDTFIYFSHYLVTIPPPCWTNAAHKHGVPVLGQFRVNVKMVVKHLLMLKQQI